MNDSRPEGNVGDATAFMVGQVEALPVEASEVEAKTRADPVLGKVLTYLRWGWPRRIVGVLEHYWRRREELSIEGDCVTWGIRIVPKALQQRVLLELNRGHPGVVKNEGHCTHLVARAQHRYRDMCTVLSGMPEGQEPPS